MRLRRGGIGSMSREVVVEMSDSVGGKKRLRKIIDLLGFVASGLMVFFVFYGVANILFSPIFNRAFNYPQECTIVGGAKGVSRSKSSSGNYYIYVETTDCPDMRYQGVRNGLTLEEVADRIDLLEGQKVTVDVGYWQLPLSDTEIVGIEGLDLSK